MHIYGYQLQNEYAARVLDPRTYHIICRDIVTRWVYPIVPDANILQVVFFLRRKIVILISALFLSLPSRMELVIRIFAAMYTRNRGFVFIARQLLAKAL